MLEDGQCAMPRPLSANCFRSALSSMQQCANQQSSLSQPTLLQMARESVGICIDNLQPGLGRAAAYVQSLHAFRSHAVTFQLDGCTNFSVETSRHPHR